jgi:hypothetical protein
MKKTKEIGADDNKQPTARDIFNGCADLGEFTELIDTTLESIPKIKDKGERRLVLIAVKDMMLEYEQHVGRKIYTYPI